MALAFSRSSVGDDEAMKLRNFGSEIFGTAVLVMTVVGSGIMAQKLSSDTGVQLLINSVSTAAILYLLITILGDVSGAHFNPLVSLIAAYKKDLKFSESLAYVASQFAVA